MARAFRKNIIAFSAVLPGLALAGCAQTPLGPTVSAVPSPGKSFEMFQADQASCQQYAAGQVKGQAEQANQRAVGAAVLTTVLGAGLGAAAGSFSGVAGQGAGLGAASGSLVGAAVGAQTSSAEQMGIQQQYDNAFVQCIYAKGHDVAGLPPHMAAAPLPAVAVGPDPALVRGIQTELIRLNYLNDTADGAIGPKTSSAIRAYEHAEGMRVDGAASQRLLAKLQSTPTSAASATTAAAPKGWVAPAGSVVPASSAAPPAAPAGWVAPTKSQ